MTLPNDVARCHGQSLYHVCDKRESCRRFLEAKLGQPHAWMAAQVPGPCEFHIPRREAPSDRREEVPSPPRPLPTPTPGDPA
jgi:hypothetical protein